MKLRDLTGQRFGRLVVLRISQRGPVRWSVRCDCGTEKAVGGSELTSAKTVSCGCKRRDACGELGTRTSVTNSRAGAVKAGVARTRHGYAKRGTSDPTYMVWEAMIARCGNSNTKKFHLYGGRGIRVHERWRAFENFIADMGERPRGLTIDRFPNRNGNYEPGNCRWATYGEQNRNLSSNRNITVGSETLCVADWEERVGARRGAIASRLSRGWDEQEAVSTPFIRRQA